MKLIAAADQNWGIGNRGALLITIPADHKRFYELTRGQVVVYGRRTLATLPQGQPLRERTNIILSRNPDFDVKDARTADSTERLFQILRDFPDREVYVIGGESIYRQLLPYCDTAYITRIDYAYAADAYFPDLDQDGIWTLAECSEEQYYHDVTYHFTRYERLGRNGRPLPPEGGGIRRAG